MSAEAAADLSLDGIGPALFKTVLRRHATGVTVVTAGADPVGLCVTSFTSVSLDPPLVSFCVGLRASSWPTLRQAPAVMIHLLADTQVALAERFARPGAARFGTETAWHRGPFDLPMLSGVMAWLAVEPVIRMAAGDHALVVCQVRQAGQTAGRRPLLHHDGEFASLETQFGSQAYPSPSRSRS